MKYIDADQICTKIKQLKEKYPSWQLKLAMDDLYEFIDSLKQDETQVDKMLCSQVWWEEQGWIMIPPDATIEGIDSLLRQVKKKLQQNEKSDKRWQPCDEHFRALKYAIEYFKKKKNDTTHLEDLYNGLKNYNCDKQ